ncbi:MAG: FHA domain-containing protein, partial [Betaproteobacteria bacterium PRO3]|nr:FHA domain-containing protein [Betaproteobacteria bacterium PRO3]
DNDVCLPYPAVSGEHAAVVTILADSFLEDLGSTNGTLVNGRPVAKHFLRDRDQIDIGRQLLVYVEDNAAKADVPASVAAREDRRELGQRVAPARVPDRVVAAQNPIDEDLGAELKDRMATPNPAQGSAPMRDGARGRRARTASRCPGGTAGSTAARAPVRADRTVSGAGRADRARRIRARSHRHPGRGDRAAWR